MNINAIKVGPKSQLLADVCSACGNPFKEGEYAVLYPIGPGDDPEERAKARAGKHYNALAIPCHAACVYGFETNTEDPNAKKESNPSNGRN